jgi:hypothetical protein
VEGDHPEATGSLIATSGFARRLASAALTGGLLGALLMVAAGWALRFAGLSGPAEAYRSFLNAGGWLWIPLWGASAGTLSALREARTAGYRATCVAVAAVLALVPLVLRPVVPDAAIRVERPNGARAKQSAFRRWAYRDPAAVANLLPYAADPDPIVREQAVLALGVNLIVTDIEHATETRPARFLASPLRDSLAARLEGAMLDPVEAVRIEAARALWNAPHALGPHPAAAETLAAALNRAAIGRPVPRANAASARIVWLALDAAAGAPDPALKAAAARFAAATDDSALRRAARIAATSAPR